MRKLLSHVISEPIIIGLMELVVLIAWAAGGMRLFIHSYFAWAVNSVQDLSLWVMIPCAFSLAILASIAVLATFQVPLLIVATVKCIAQRSRSRRSGV
ncbi:hypothetical protein WM40_25390 [Robbsia andropogonis]|uniref:Uncharacterized protein n=1 Tax=Robbsia andropogonis TaxID=28092 RepID=A0A0F5JTA6_9BURK|nr:hypothetical protein WM40_25390 [Robbsia andropogonis]